MPSSKQGTCVTLINWNILKVELDFINLSYIRAAAVNGKSLGKITFVLPNVFFHYLTFTWSIYYKNMNTSYEHTFRKTCGLEKWGFSKGVFIWRGKCDFSLILEKPHKKSGSLFLLSLLVSPELVFLQHQLIFTN